MQLAIVGDADAFYAWGRYLYWAELMRRDWFAYMEKHGGEKGDYPNFLSNLCYWGASLHVVVEGWETANFQDPIIEALLKVSNYKDELRRLRNGTFHYQPTLISPKLVGLFRSSEGSMWLYTLHEEFCRWARDVVEDVASKGLLSASQAEQWRKDFAEITGWLPLRPGEEELLGLRDTLHEFHAEILNTGGSASREADEVREALGQWDTVVKDSADRMRNYRRECLARVGLNPDDYIP